MSNAQIVAKTNQYLMANYGRLPLATAKASDARVWDSDGREYIDMFAGFGAAALGHCHPKVVKAVQDAAAEMMCVGNLFTWQSQVDLAEKIVTNSFGDGKVFYCNSGAEADEAALKLARKAAGPGRYKMISFYNNFHGRTMGGLSMTAKPAIQEDFLPMLEGAIYAQMNDIDSVANLVDDETAGVIIEPIQGEGGVNLPTNEFMVALRRLCDDKKLTLICDEVWTAPARTGKWFGYQHYDMTPDVITLGKATGGGLPVAACVARAEFGDVLTPGTHGCTLGGNPVCAAAGNAVFEAIAEENLVEVAKTKGEKIVQMFTDANLSRVVQIRGKGLMLGVELDGPAGDVFKYCLENNVMINYTAEKVLRVAPPMTIEADLLEKGIETIIKALKQ